MFFNIKKNGQKGLDLSGIRLNLGGIHQEGLLVPFGPTEIVPVEPWGVINSPKMRAIQTTMALAGLTSMSPMGIKMNSISP